ncbi:MAG: sulfatase family protein [Limimaricola soesokkakensis]|uniref:sulfatase family protein n=1 Tax=Limimaricola soesokkakensis TaxID=1343159 RepID=UPI0040594694
MTKRPNFLFIITDQHRADHLGCYGNGVVNTPHIDGIAARGTRFERFYVANPICMPNRASIMTGRMCSAHGARHNGIPLSRNHTTFVELLRDAGYRTGLIGKSHLQSFTGLPASNAFVPQPGKHVPAPHLRDAFKDNRHSEAYDLEHVGKWDRPLADRAGGDFYGFEHVEVAADHADQACGDYLLWARSQHPDFDSLTGPENALPDDRIKAPQAWRTAVPEELYSTSWVADRSVAWLEQRAREDAPFFLQMSFPDPHHPFTPPGRYWDMYDPDRIELPPSFGKSALKPVRAMREAMERGTDPRDNQSPFAVTEDEARAIIALTYGMISMVDDAIGRVLARLDALGLAEDTVVIFTSDHGDYMGDHGLMLKLLLHYQSIIRVPFIWSDPQAPRRSEVSDELSSSIDIASTILARAGVQGFNGMQGRDLFGDPPPEAVIVEEDSQRVMTGFDRPQRVRTMITGRYRMSLRHGEDWSELYDLRTDPDELHNLYDDEAHAATRAQLTETMLRRMVALQDRAPLPAYRA